MKNITFCAIVAATFIFLAGAHAGNQAGILTSNGPAYAWEPAFANPNQAATIGWTFTVGPQNNLNVHDLGFYDGGDVPLITAHEIGIWNASGSLLSSVTIPAGASTNYSSGYAYSAIASPITLLAGQSYTIGAYYPGVTSGGDKFITSSSQTFEADIIFGHPVLSSLSTSGVFTDPTILEGVYADGFFGPNFEFTTTPAPEPAPATLLALGVLVFTVAKGKSSKKGQMPACK